MEENIVTNFNRALIDVRRAHRLIYAYQRRMLDLAYYIKNRLNFPEFQGGKLFSHSIRNKRNGYQHIFHEMWAWDFIYSYVYEYNFGEIELVHGSLCSLSLVQYSDTGYFDIDEDNLETNLDSFLEPEKSNSKLLFYLEVKLKSAKDWKWDIESVSHDKKYASKEFQKEIIRDKKHIQVFYSFPLDRFVNEKTAIEALKEFLKYCKDEEVVDLELV